MNNRQTDRPIPPVVAEIRAHTKPPRQVDTRPPTFAEYVEDAAGLIAAVIAAIGIFLGTVAVSDAIRAAF